MIRIYKTKDYEEMSRIGAEIVAAQIILKQDSVIGLATGSSPIGLYERLIEKYRTGILDFSKVRGINLDEYKGIRPDNEQSYAYFMYEHFYQHVNVKPENQFIPNGQSLDEDEVCGAYNEIYASLGAPDLQILGIGHDGHIGFNEPTEDFPVETHCVQLTEEPIQANRRFFTSIEEVPKEAYTMGIGQIMQAKKIVLLVSGKDKAEILKESLSGRVTPHVPASVLQLHRDVRVVADEAALSAWKYK